MLRLWLVLVTMALVTAALIPFQALSLFFKWPARRTIPLLYHRIVCAMIGVRVHVVGAPSVKRPLMVLANHSSWLDIPVITSALSVVFVAKREIARWPLFGLLAKLQRSVFVDRERRHKTAETSSEMAQRLLDGDPVLLFAEGTSSDGNRVLPFRTALIGAARKLLFPRAGSQDAAKSVDHVTIQPLSIAYVRLHGLPVGRQHRNTLAWYGTIGLLPHLVGVVRSGAVDVVLTWGEPTTYDHGTDRKHLAKAMQAAVRRMTSGVLRAGAVPKLPMPQPSHAQDSAPTK